MAYVRELSILNPSPPLNQWKQSYALVIKPCTSRGPGGGGGLPTRIFLVTIIILVIKKILPNTAFLYSALEGGGQCTTKKYLGGHWCPAPPGYVQAVIYMMTRSVVYCVKCDGPQGEYLQPQKRPKVREYNFSWKLPRFRMFWLSCIWWSRKFIHTKRKFIWCPTSDQNKNQTILIMTITRFHVVKKILYYMLIHLKGTVHVKMNHIDYWTHILLKKYCVFYPS